MREQVGNRDDLEEEVHAPSSLIPFSVKCSSHIFQYYQFSGKKRDRSWGVVLEGGSTSQGTSSRHYAGQE